MTAKQVLRHVLSELNKVNVPSLLLEDFNYFFNKAINQYINKRYNLYDVNQQLSDDLRVLKSSAILTPKLASDTYKELYNADESVFDEDWDGDVALLDALDGGTYEVDLPDDYLHILNCVCLFKVNQNYDCYNGGTYATFGANRLTADMSSEIENNFYMQPSYRRPYYYIHNVNIAKEGDMPTNPVRYDENGKYIGGTDYLPEKKKEEVKYYLSLSTTGLSWDADKSNSQKISITSFKIDDEEKTLVEYEITDQSSDYFSYSYDEDQNLLTIQPKYPNDATVNRTGKIIITQKESGKQVVLSLTHKGKIISYELIFGVGYFNSKNDCCDDIQGYINNPNDITNYKTVSIFYNPNSSDNKLTFKIDNLLTKFNGQNNTKLLFIDTKNIPSEYKTDFKNKFNSTHGVGSVFNKNSLEIINNIVYNKVKTFTIDNDTFTFEFSK